MTPIDASSTIPATRLHFGVDATPGLPEPARQGGDELLSEPPKEAAELELEGTIRFTLQERASEAWEILKEARSTGLPMDQAQELISELVYPPLESDDN